MERVDVTQTDTMTATEPETPNPDPPRRSLQQWRDRSLAALTRSWDAFQQWLFSLGSRALLAALGVVIFGVALNALVAYVSIQTISDRDAWVVHTHTVLAQIATVQTDLLDAQTGARGYVITGDQSYLGPFTRAVAALDADMQTLKALTSDNPAQMARIVTLQKQVPPELSELQAWIDLRSAGRVAEANARVDSGVDHQQMIAIRATLSTMDSTEDALLHSRDASAQAAVRAALVSVSLAIIADLVLLFVIVAILRRALQVRESAVAEAARSEARARVYALEEATRRMEEFLGVAGHELRTPLTSALANVQIAARQLARLRDGSAPANSDQLRRLLSATEGQLHRQARLVDDLLDVTRIESGNLRFRLGDANLVTLARRAVEEQQRVRPERVIDLRVPVDADGAPIFADADRIEQVLTNYLTNALKYSPSDAPVEVEVSAEGGIARVAVRDRGPGVPAAERELIWDRFHRTSGVEVQSGSGIGLGLGLFISKSFVERHGGSVGVGPRADGPGSEFWFTLPLAKKSGAPSSHQQAERAEA